jgi:hypothetical protein
VLQCFYAGMYVLLQYNRFQSDFYDKYNTDVAAIV